MPQAVPSRSWIAPNRCCFWVLLCSLLMSLPGSAQQTIPPAAQQDDREPLETFRVDVEIVNLFFNVKDRRGALLAGLTREEFEIYEDGKKQTIRYFSASSDQPLTLGLLLDTSGSMQRILPVAQEVAASFLQAVMREKDMAFLISFDVNVDLLQDFTQSPRELRAALRRARINTGTGGGLPGLGGGPVPISRPRGTLLFDAVYLGAREKLAREVGRKSMIILSDGADMGSRVRLRDAIEAAHKADAICYVLLISDEYSGEGDMKKLAEETGGRVLRVGDRTDKLKQAFDQIASELRSQYNIGYNPTNQTRDGSYRKVEIKTRSGYRVQARKGYYAAGK